MQKACAKISWSHFSFRGQPSTILQMDIFAYFLVSSNVDSDAKDDEGPESHTCLQAQTPVFSHKLEILFRFYLFLTRNFSHALFRKIRNVNRAQSLKVVFMNFEFLSDNFPCAPTKVAPTVISSIFCMKLKAICCNYLLIIPSPTVNISTISFWNVRATLVMHNSTLRKGRKLRTRVVYARPMHFMTSSMHSTYRAYRISIKVTRISMFSQPEALCLQNFEISFKSNHWVILAIIIA